MTTNLILAHKGLKTAKAAGECSMVGVRCRDSEIRVAESGIRSRCAWLSLDWLNPSLGGPPRVGREDGLDNTLHRGVSSKGLISKRDKTQDTLPPRHPPYRGQREQTGNLKHTVSELSRNVGLPKVVENTTRATE